MKVQALFDSEGQLIALMESSTDESRPQACPVPGEGQNAAELDVPEEYAASSLAEILTRLRVDLSDGAPRLVAR
ncbi:hypothetical protein [Streptomyces sp. URMC 123]|uniref:hypothetical protein n=1 Tax=Streptomyces sp. URMC 123 TaxID=3423403 RepID=UPI003F1CE5FB